MSDQEFSTPEVPSAIGRYRIVEHLASDTVDDVYRGFDPMIERPVAVKVFRLRHADPSSRAGVKQVFYREMQRAGLLVHPAIVTLFDAGELPGGLFMANEFVESESLASLLKRGLGADLPTRVSLISQMVDALEYAREQGIWHLNLKPTNVLVSPDYTLKVGSFCVAQVVDALVAASSLTLPTPSRYVAPERARGEQGDQRSDVYSLATLALDVLTRSPHEAWDSTAPYAVPPPLPAYLVDQGIDAARWASLFESGLAESVAHRFDTPASFRMELLLTLGVGEAEARLAWETSRAEGARQPGQEEDEAQTILAPSSSRVPDPPARPRPDVSEQETSETIFVLPEGPDAITHTGIGRSSLLPMKKKGDGQG